MLLIDGNTMGEHKNGWLKPYQVNLTIYSIKKLYILSFKLISNNNDTETM
jgi:hypothetical protein